jgi:hypothetical protein
MATKPNKTERTGKVSYNPEVRGSTGLRQFGGFVHEEFLPELKGIKGLRVYREMADNDATIGALLFAITNLIKQAKWDVEASGDSPEAEEMKEFLEQCLEDMSMPLSSVIDDVCSMFTYGFAPCEIVWKRRLGPEHPSAEGRSKFNDARVGIRGIIIRAQETISKWDIDEEDGSIDGLWQQPYSGPITYIPIEKLLLFRTTENRMNPEGRSILRTAYRAWHYKKRIENIEAVGVERDLAGYPVAYIPAKYMDSSADAREKQIYSDWQLLATSIKRDQREGIVIPSDRDANGNLLFDLKLLSTAGSRAIDTTKIIDRYDRRIATAVLADFLFLGQSSVGSFALSSDKTALFATAIGAFMKMIADTFNRHLIPRLMQLNGWDLEFAPRLVPEDIETPNIQEIADAISKLSGAGATFFPDEALENRVRGYMGLPPVPEEGLDMREHVNTITPQDPNAEPAAEDDEDGDAAE